LSCHTRSMISMGPLDRSTTRDQLASWDNEGGATLLDWDAAEETQAALTEEEENIFRCLGAAVILQWNDLPTQIQRLLFENTASMAEPHHVPQLKEKIARFLHEHKHGCGCRSVWPPRPAHRRNPH
jgi:hypothetical protein